MNSFIYFDHCAFIVEAIILFSLIVRRMTRGRVNRWALALITDIMLTTVADICALTFEALDIGSNTVRYIANMFDIWGTTQTAVIFTGYLFALIGIWHKIHEKRALTYVYVIPSIIMTVLVIVVNPFVNIIFRIDENGIYQRGPAYFALYALSYCYVLVGYFEVIKYRKLFSSRKMFSIFLVFVIMVCASIIQGVFPDRFVQMFFLSITFLITVLGVQSPEERMHGSTGLFSMNAFVQDVNKYKILDAPIGVTISVMTNYNALTEMLGYFTVQSIIADTAKRLEKWATISRVDADLYYLGGGRFAVITDDRYEENWLTISQGVNAVLAKEAEVGEMSVKVMNNVCFINWPKDIDDPEFLFSFDGRLEKEAYSGELRYAEKLFDKKRFELRRDISKVIDRAFEQKLFALHFQPVFSVKDNRFVRAEAFLRLNDPEFGQILPDILISEAEKINSIHAITTFVIEEVCRFISLPDFLLLGLDYVEINLSPTQCMWSDLLPVLLSTMKNYNVQAKNIGFNITDVDSQEVFEKMCDNIDALSQVGFTIFMDDFGAGIFEVERIARMPLSGIKFDRHFVKEGLKTENDAVFEGSLRMIRDLEIDAVCVGVEDENMRDRLIECGCNYLQGYYYCRPLEKKELIRFILMG